MYDMPGAIKKAASMNSRPKAPSSHRQAKEGSLLKAPLRKDVGLLILSLEQADLAGPGLFKVSDAAAQIADVYQRLGDYQRGPHNWGYVATVTPQQPDPVPIPRGKVVGGSSAINGQVLLLGLPEDYDDWAAWGNEEWTFTKVLRYFRKLETDLDFRGDFHGSDGPVPVPDARVG